METMKAGNCGVNVSWKWDPNTGKITIFGTGAMTDYEETDLPPWGEFRDEIRELVVEEGVTNLGDYSFTRCERLERFVIPSTVEVIGTYAFGYCRALTEAVLPEGVKVISAKSFNTNTALKKVHIPLSLEAIDMKAFEYSPAIEEVSYPGTLEQWKEIRISMSANGNRHLLKAYKKDEPAQTWHHFYHLHEPAVLLFEIAGEIIRQGGDGRFHILAVQLSTVDVITKSGDFTLLILPDGKTMMIDAGVDYCEEKAMAAVKALGLTTLDYFMTSHPHQDHVGNALTIAKYLYDNGGSVGTYFHTGHVFKTLEPAFSAYLQEKNTVMDNHLTRGDVRQFGEVKMEVLRPTKQMLIDGVDLQGDAINALSLTVKFTYGKASYLTGGDLYRPDEREVVSVYGDYLKSTVLKACHHGVFTSNSNEWIETISPEVILIHGDDIGATALERKTKSMGIACFSSGLDGSVLVSMTKDGDVEVKTGYGKTYSKKSGS